MTRSVSWLVPAALFASAVSFAQAPGTPGGDFADAPEKALVEQTCTACHVAEQVTAQRHSKADWSNLVDKMIGFGAQVPDDKYDLIVNYLAVHYPR